MILGVDPPRQGVGGAPIQPRYLAHTDVEGLPCYLETMKTRNVPVPEGTVSTVIVKDAFAQRWPATLLT